MFSRLLDFDGSLVRYEWPAAETLQKTIRHARSKRTEQQFYIQRGVFIISQVYGPVKCLPAESRHAVNLRQRRVTTGVETRESTAR